MFKDVFIILIIFSMKIECVGIKEQKSAQSHFHIPIIVDTLLITVSNPEHECLRQKLKIIMQKEVTKNGGGGTYNKPYI